MPRARDRLINLLVWIAEDDETRSVFKAEKNTKRRKDLYEKAGLTRKQIKAIESADPIHEILGLLFDDPIRRGLPPGPLTVLV